MRIFILVSVIVLCLVAAAGPVMAGNAYGLYKHTTDSTGTDELATNWTCDTSYDSATGVATVQFTVDNLAELLATPGLVTASWSNIVIDAEQEITIDSLIMGLDGDPAINLNFAVSGGNSGATFHIVSTELAFPTLTNCVGIASAGVTVTDYLLMQDGATANGLFGGKFYEARYNASSIYGDLVSGPVVIPAGGGTQTVSENGTLQNLGTVSSMQSEFFFDVTAKDQVSGTSSYAIAGIPVPEPSGIIALISGLLGATAIIRRRK